MPAAAVKPALIVAIRIRRMALGIALALLFYLLADWPGAFVAPILASAILTLPMPAPNLKFAAGFIALLGGALMVGLLFLPLLHYQPMAAVLLILLALFHCFYYGTRGGSPAVITFLVIGLTVIPAIGSESIDAALGITGGLISGAVASFLIIALVHCLFPDPELPPPPPAARPALPLCASSALRSTVIVVPPLLWMLLTSESSAYAAVLIKVAAMGQQSSLESTRAAGKDLLDSTLVGGLAAIVVWNILQIWPTPLIYCLLYLLAGLIFGPRIFSGAGLAPRGAMWAYGLLTMMVIIMPGAMDTAGGDGAQTRFFDRVSMFGLATLYAVAAVHLFDRLWPRAEQCVIAYPDTSR